MSQLIVEVVGAVSGAFIDDEKNRRTYAKVHVLENLKADPTRDLEAIGKKADTYTATPEAYAVIKGHRLPSRFICDIESTTSATKGTKIKIVSAEAFGQSPVVTK